MPISELDFKERSLLFAKLAKITYFDEKEARSEAKKLGFTTTEFYEASGAQAYRFMNKDDLVIACRGTQPTEWNDIKADLRAIPVLAETVSRVHKGFKREVDELWPMVCEDINRKVNLKKDLWFCGHSLGAAMATIMASRARFNEDLNDPTELYTYGSPRVGWRNYVNSLDVTHHRWVNNNDVVTRVPFTIMGYVHHGEEHYMNAWGNIRTPTYWQRVKDRFRGMWMGIKQGKIDNFSDHSMVNYIDNLETYNKGMEKYQY